MFMYWEWSHPKKQIYRSLRFGIGPLLKINQPTHSRFPSVSSVPHPLPLVSPAPPHPPTIIGVLQLTLILCQSCVVVDLHYVLLHAVGKLCLTQFLPIMCRSHTIVA
jgi:hypothetical protein